MIDHEILLDRLKEWFVKHHLFFYADNTQVLNSFNMSSLEDSIQNRQNFLVSVQERMFKNKLKLNPDKTEFLPHAHNINTFTNT